MSQNPWYLLVGGGARGTEHALVRGGGRVRKRHGLKSEVGSGLVGGGGGG